MWFERIIKGRSSKPKSIWCANVQLALIGVTMGYATGMYNDGNDLAEYGFFKGFSFSVWMAVFLQGLGGKFIQKLSRK